MTVVNIQWPSGGATDSDIAPNAGIQASKGERQRSATVELFAEGATITALASKILATIRGAQGTLLAFEAVIFTQATGADRTVSVNLHKSTGAGAFATICTTPCQITNSTAIRTMVPAVLSDTSLVDGDILRAVVTVAGSAGAQALGLAVTLHFREDPD